MTDNIGLNRACRLTGDGGAMALEATEVVGWTPGDGMIWADLDAASPAAARWLRQGAGLPTHVADGLLATETRPRCEWFEEGVLLILRGVNLNPGATPEDMISLRLWIEDGRVISTRLRRLMAVEDIHEQFAAGRGPVSAGHLVARLAARLTERMGPVIDEMEDEVAALEDALVGEDGDLRKMRPRLITLRRRAISLRRYIAPQRDALDRLSLLDDPWIDARVRGRLRDAVDRVARITEALDEARERSLVAQDELMNRISQRMERTMYALTLVATIVMPVGLVTGLLGVNVAGVPGAETGWAFWALSAGLAAMMAAEVWLFRRLGWL